MKHIIILLLSSLTFSAFSNEHNFIGCEIHQSAFDEEAVRIEFYPFPVGVIFFFNQDDVVSSTYDGLIEEVEGIIRDNYNVVMTYSLGQPNNGLLWENEVLENCYKGKGTLPL